jgi:hypothetical protein
MTDDAYLSLIRRAQSQYAGRVALGLCLALVFGAVLGYAAHEIVYPPGVVVREPCPAGYAPQRHRILRWEIGL